MFFRERIRLRNRHPEGTLPIIEPKQKGPCPLGPLPTKEIIDISDDDETCDQTHTADEWRVFIIPKTINAKATPNRRNNRLKGTIPIYKK